MKDLCNYPSSRIDTKCVCVCVRITGTSALPFPLNHLAPVVQKLDSAIHYISNG